MVVIVKDRIEQLEIVRSRFRIPHPRNKGHVDEEKGRDEEQRDLGTPGFRKVLHVSPIFSLAESGIVQKRILMPS